MKENEYEFLNLDIDEENQGSVRRIEEGFNKLDSRAILGFTCQRYRYGKWIQTYIFNPITTNGPSNPGGKKPVTKYGVETREIIKLQKASSPMNYYIDNVALKPNASGHGGNGGWKYASSEYGDLLKTFKQNGVKGLIKDSKQIVIPDALQKHITQTNRVISNVKNPLGTLNSFAKTQSKKAIDPSLERLFKFSKNAIKIGFDATEFIIAPEATIGKVFWSLGHKKPTSLGKNIAKKTKVFKKL